MKRRIEPYLREVETLMAKLAERDAELEKLRAETERLRKFLQDIRNDLVPDQLHLDRTPGSDPCDCVACRLAREFKQGERKD